MLLEPLRNRVRKLESELLEKFPGYSKEIRRCALGDHLIFSEFLISNPEDGDLAEWETSLQGDFFGACMDLKTAEESELKSAFAAAR